MLPWPSMALGEGRKGLASPTAVLAQSEGSDGGGLKPKGKRVSGGDKCVN